MAESVCPKTGEWSGNRGEKPTCRTGDSSHAGGAVILVREFNGRTRTGTACHLHAWGVRQEAGESGSGLGQGFAGLKRTVEHAGRRTHFNCSRARRMGHFLFVTFGGGQTDSVCNIHARVTEPVVVARKEAAPEIGKVVRQASDAT